MQIFVDADACPVVDIVETIAEKYNISTRAIIRFCFRLLSVPRFDPFSSNAARSESEVNYFFASLIGQTFIHIPHLTQISSLM